MIRAEVMIVGDRRGPESWFGFRPFDFALLPRVGEVVTTPDGWSYYVTYVDYDLRDQSIHLIVNCNPKGQS